jgi:hypothetical protein
MLYRVLLNTNLTYKVAYLSYYSVVIGGIIRGNVASVLIDVIVNESLKESVYVLIAFITKE